MSKIKHILWVIHYTIHYKICGAVCFQFTHSPCDDWENIYTLSYYHHQIGSMNYYPLFRVRLWNNGVRCMSFYILFNEMLIENHTFSFKKMHLKMSSGKWQPFCLCLNVLNHESLNSFQLKRQPALRPKIKATWQNDIIEHLPKCSKWLTINDMFIMNCSFSHHFYNYDF